MCMFSCDIRESHLSLDLHILVTAYFDKLCSIYVFGHRMLAIYYTIDVKKNKRQGNLDTIIMISVKDRVYVYSHLYVYMHRERIKKRKMIE